MPGGERDRAGDEELELMLQPPPPSKRAQVSTHIPQLLGVLAAGSSQLPPSGENCS